MVSQPFPKNMNLAEAHTRDKDVEFDEPAHKYTIKGCTDFTSVTTFIGTLFEKFDADAVVTKMMKGRNWANSKYYGMSAEEIKQQWADAGTEAAAEGTKMHAEIENYYKTNREQPSVITAEFAQFLAFAENFKLRPYRSEWRVYDEDIKIVGTVDMLFETPDGKICIYDWKRAKKIEKFDNWGKRCTHPLLSHVHDTNFWHYALQLNLYQYILENKYGLTVCERALVCCHPTRTHFERVDIPDMQEEIRLLFSTTDNV